MIERNNNELTLELENIIEELQSFSSTYKRLKYTAISKIAEYENKLKLLEDDYKKKEETIKSIFSEKIKYLIENKSDLITEDKEKYILKCLSCEIILFKEKKTLKTEYDILLEFVKNTNPEYLLHITKDSLNFGAYRSSLKVSPDGLILNQSGNKVEGLSFETEKERIEIKYNGGE